MVNSVLIDGEFLLEWCEYFDLPLANQLAVVHQLCITV